MANGHDARGQTGLETAKTIAAESSTGLRNLARDSEPGITTALFHLVRFTNENARMMCMS